MVSDQWLPIGSDVPAADEAPETHDAAAPEPEVSSLAALIRAGDPDALLGFRDAHEPAVRAYMDETVCSEDRVEEAVDSSFTDLFGRLTADGDESTDLEALLLISARSVAAGRFEVRSDRPHGPELICLSAPELLAARDIGELESSEQLEIHLEHCPTCQGSAERMREGERRFAAATPGAAAAPGAAAESQPALEAPPQPASEPPPEPPAPEPEPPAPEPEPPAPEPEPPAPAAPQPPPPQAIVRRSGGLVGGLRKTFEDISRRRNS